MKRKNFIRSVLGSVAALHIPETGSSKQNIISNTGFTDVKIPDYLNPGDVIGICSPAGYISIDDLEPAINKIREWGFHIYIGSSIGKRDYNFGGSDEDRRNDLQSMLDDKNIKAIMCARGGYGIVRIIDNLNFKSFEKNPKWIIGFSDITVLHSHIYSNYQIAGIHSKMTNSFPLNWNAADDLQKASIDSIRKCLTGIKMNYMSPANANNKFGNASGVVVGGNLRTLESIVCSRSELNSKDSILFLEDTGEYLYSIDRMLWNMDRSGKLANLRGLIIGGFKIKPDDPGEAFGRTLEQIVLEKVSKYSYPVCFQFPVGHQKNNFALKCGVKHKLTVNQTGASLIEE